MDLKHKTVSINARILMTGDGYSVIHVPAMCHGVQVDATFLLDTGTNISMVSEQMEIPLWEETLLQTSDLYKVNRLPQVEGKTVHGILGTDFLMNNRLVLDYNENTLSNDTAKDCNLRGRIYFPMDIGLTSSHLPLILAECHGECHFFIADTGANANVILEKSLKTGCFKTVPLKTSSMIYSMKGSSCAEEYRLAFNLLLYRAGAACLMPVEGTFEAVGDDDIIKPAHDNRLQVDGIIGNRFLHDHGWVLDFNRRIIFKKILPGMFTFPQDRV